jgi:hypothetical protein
MLNHAPSDKIGLSQIISRYSLEFRSLAHILTVGLY